MKSFIDKSLSIIKSILLGSIVCMYMSLSLYILKNKDDFILGEYAYILVAAFFLYISYCVGKTIIESDENLRG